MGYSPWSHKESDTPEQLTLLLFCVTYKVEWLRLNSRTAHCLESVFCFSTSYFQFNILGWEDLFKKGLATHSSILAWRMPWTEEPGRLQSMGSQRVRHD